MPTEAKRETVGSSFVRSSTPDRTMIVSEYRGLKVKEISEIRRALRKQSVTLPGRQEPPDADRRAQDNAAAAALSPLLVGPTAIAFGTTTRRRRPRRCSMPSGRTTRSSRSPAACSAPARSTPTASRGSRPCPHARSSSPSALGAITAPMSTMRRPVRRTCATGLCRWRRSTRSSKARRRGGLTAPSPTSPNRAPRGAHARRTSTHGHARPRPDCSRPSSR